jgi:hypothetical protein
MLPIQIGNGDADHSVWTRPEDITASYPVYTISPQAPGSDLAGAMAAALAATSVVFKTSDPTYAAACLTHAHSIYTYAARAPYVCLCTSASHMLPICRTGSCFMCIPCACNKLLLLLLCIQVSTPQQMV